MGWFISISLLIICHFRYRQHRSGGHAALCCIDLHSCMDWLLLRGRGYIRRPVMNGNEGNCHNHNRSHSTTPIAPAAVFPLSKYTRSPDLIIYHAAEGTKMTKEALSEGVKHCCCEAALRLFRKNRSQPDENRRRAALLMISENLLTMLQWIASLAPLS